MMAGKIIDLILPLLTKSIFMTAKKDKIVEIEEAVVRFAGDSGDGMQLTGSLFSDSTAFAGNDFATFPDYPSEIRAPQGTVSGVSGFQIHFGHKNIHTTGDLADVLVAMNPASLKANLMWVKKDAIIILNSDEFTEKNLERAGFDSNPLEDNSLTGHLLVLGPLSTLTKEAVKDLDMDSKSALKSKNMFALGIIYYLFNRDFTKTFSFFETKFKKNPLVVKANKKVLEAGYNYAETLEVFSNTYRIEKASLNKGHYRNVTGNLATAWGLLAASERSGRKIYLGSYPITPASEILHALSALRNYGVKTFQAEDEIAGVSSAIGASFSGDLAATTTSGPGLALKTEALGLAVMTELPLVIVDVQRGGPSTGLPTKTEQSDLLQAVYGRNGEAPMPVIAAKSPSDCFQVAFEAARIALKYMTPVLLLSDGYLGMGSEPWRIVNPDDLPEIKVSHPDKSILGEDGVFKPYERDEKTLARPWALPGTPGLEHRIGGLEKEDITGHVNYDPLNHEKMIHLRDEKIKRVADEYPETEIYGSKDGGKLLLIGWGSTYGALKEAVDLANQEGLETNLVHFSEIWPFPAEATSRALQGAQRLFSVENNATAQLAHLIRAETGYQIMGKIAKFDGRPFSPAHILRQLKKEIS